MWNLCPSVLWIRQQDVCGTCVPVYCGSDSRMYVELVSQCTVTGSDSRMYVELVSQCTVDQTAGCMWNLCPSVLWIRQQDVCGTCVPVYCDWIRQQDVCGTCVPVYCGSGSRMYVELVSQCTVDQTAGCMWNLCPSVLWIRQQDVCGTCVPVYCRSDSRMHWNLCPRYCDQTGMYVELVSQCGCTQHYSGGPVCSNRGQKHLVFSAVCFCPFVCFHSSV